MDYIQSIYLQHYHQSVFTRKEHIHVRDYLVVNNDQETEGEEWCVLEDYVQEDSPNVNVAATTGAERTVPVNLINMWKHNIMLTWSNSPLIHRLLVCVIVSLIVLW